MSRWLSLVWLLPVAALWTACTPPAPTPPSAEFIIATPDSAFWVRSGVEGVRVRTVPMALAHYGGRYHEVYVADLDRSFSDAVITGERLYTRDILTGDSTLVYDDTAILTLALEHARTTPDAHPLSEDDDAPDDPDLTATGEIDILDVRGPYVLFEHRFSVDTGSDGSDGDADADTVRGAIDLRTGKAVPPLAVLMMVRDSSMVLTLPRTWRRGGYELVARNDTVRNGVAFGLRDTLHHVWTIATAGEYPHVYWLDAPPVDAQTRRALMHAFNSAATYDEAVKYVRNVAPRRKTRITTVTRVVKTTVRSSAPRRHA